MYNQESHNSSNQTKKKNFKKEGCLHVSHPEKPVRPSNMLAPTSLKSKQLQQKKSKKINK